MLLGLAWAALGVVCFSITFPATVFALRAFDAASVGAGRSVLAALLAAPALYFGKARRFRRGELPGLVAVAIGCGVGFGLLSALALQTVSASHAGVVIALLPVATAIFAVLRAGDRPGPLFWAASLVGSAAVTAFALRQGIGGLHYADALLGVALVIGGWGYAEGGRLARGMPGWQVVSWGLLLALPISLPITVLSLATHHHPQLRADSVAGLVYVSTVSVYFSFFAWYHGLATGGIARASQLQLLQPFFTLALASVLLSERPGLDAFMTAGVVILCVVGTQRARDHGVETPDVAALERASS
ncbi:MAG: DMT family transporter [Candidatus Dormibacteria bacterium]